MDHLDRGARDFEALGNGPGQFAGRKAQQRPHPLAALEDRVAHGLVQARGHRARRRQHARKRRFHARLDVAHPGLEVGRISRHWCREPARRKGS